MARADAQPRREFRVDVEHHDVLLLAALEDGPRHGYAVKETLRQGSGGRFDLPTGTVYPALHRLEHAGLISGTWSIVDGRRRREYRLTKSGLRRLHADRTNWHGFAAAITALLERRPWPPRADRRLPGVSAPRQLSSSVASRRRFSGCGR